MMISGIVSADRPDSHQSVELVNSSAMPSEAVRIKMTGIGAPMKSEHPKPILLADYRPPDFLIDNVDLDITLDPARTRVVSKLSIRRNPASQATGKIPLKLDGELLELESISLNGKKLRRPSYVVDDTSLTLVSPPKEPFT